MSVIPTVMPQYVSIHAPARGATCRRPPACRFPCRFQSTRPRGARQQRFASTSLRCMFQSTRPRGARRGSAPSSARPTVFQSTRPRGARRVASARGRARNRVSIHAPARGATAWRECDVPGQMFQSTRPRGARRRRNCCMRTGSSFNPRAREGRDSRTGCPAALISCFNPRAREGRDVSCCMSMKSALEFQSTRPRGARRQRPHQPDARQRFNPRAREGRDCVVRCVWFDDDVSIHAPARGATERQHGDARGRGFQSTRPRGARRAVYRGALESVQFQSTRPRGARLF